MNYFNLISVSKSRFWIYIAGIYLIGAAIGFESIFDIRSPIFWMHFVFFSLPVNMYLISTEKMFNETKKNLNKDLKIWLFVFGLMFLSLVFFQVTLLSKLLLFLFLFLSLLPLAMPLKNNAKPVVNFLSSGFYLIPGILGYIHFSENKINWFLVFGFLAWTYSMYLFFLIPNILTDQKESIKTLATLLGYEKSLMLCGFLWSVFAMVILSQPGWLPWSAFSLVYPLIPFYLLLNPEESVLKYYWYLPFINALLGLGVYVIMISKLI